MKDNKSLIRALARFSSDIIYGRRHHRRELCVCVYEMRGVEKKWEEEEEEEDSERSKVRNKKAWDLFSWKSRHFLFVLALIFISKHCNCSNSIMSWIFIATRTLDSYFFPIFFFLFSHQKSCSRKVFFSNLLRHFKSSWLWAIYVVHTHTLTLNSNLFARPFVRSFGCFCVWSIACGLHWIFRSPKSQNKPLILNYTHIVILVFFRSVEILFASWFYTAQRHLYGSKSYGLYFVALIFLLQLAVHSGNDTEKIVMRLIYLIKFQRMIFSFPSLSFPCPLPHETVECNALHSVVLTLLLLPSLNFVVRFIGAVDVAHK